MAKSSWTVSASRDPELAFWTFVTYCLVVVTVTVFYLFYLNRLVAFLLSRAVCYYTWRRHRAWVELESIALAPLAGKLMFKNLRYSSRNQSFSVLRGYVSFRYWIFRVQTEASAAAGPVLSAPVGSVPSVKAPAGSDGASGTALAAV
jgi:hypothetical protein